MTDSFPNSWGAATVLTIKKPNKNGQLTTNFV